MGNSCTSYIKATVDINFPAEHVCCGLCPEVGAAKPNPLMLEKGEEKDGD